MLCDVLTYSFENNTNQKNLQTVQSGYPVIFWILVYLIVCFECISFLRSGSVVECLTQEREAAGSSLTSVTAL